MIKEKSYLEVSIPALIYNLGVVRSYLADNTKIIAVVKANAYGLGAEEVSKALLKNKVNFLAVALVKEAIALRKRHIQTKILILSPFTDNEIGSIIKYNLIPSVISLERAHALSKMAIKHNRIIKVHVKTDTGMGRLGTRTNEVASLIKNMRCLKNLCIEGIYSHLASADIPDIAFTERQIKSFAKIKNIAGRNAIYHLANSSGIVGFKHSHFNAVRPGLLLYGAYPSRFIKDKVKLKKVVKLKSTIVSIKTIDKGDSVSYARTFIANKKTKVAIIPIGYADGISTLLSNKGEVVVKEKKVPVIGRVCMDYTTLNVNDTEKLSIGDEVTLIGNGIKNRAI